MLKKVIMPTLGLDIEEAVIEKWLKREGDEVVLDEPLLVVETDKASTEINAPASGVLKQILQGEGATVAVTHPVALIETAEASAVEATSPPTPAATETSPLPAPLAGVAMVPSAPVPADAARAHPFAPRVIVRASPAARNVARLLGVDLSQVTGTGVQGRIQGEDVRRFAATQERPAAAQVATPPKLESQPGEKPSVSPAPAGLPGRLIALGRKRRITAERMALSARTVARITLNMEVDAAQLVALRSRLLPIYEASDKLRISYNDLLVKVVATALAEHPALNARWADQGIYLLDQVNVGVAVAVEDGLVVPVIRDAGRKRLVEIATEAAALVVKAREDRLSMDEMTGGSFTITNLGMFDVDSFTPIVNPPETAILGVGRIVEKPVGHEGAIVLRPRIVLSLSFDHRVVDGAPAARFLQRIKQLIEEPFLLV